MKLMVLKKMGYKKKNVFNLRGCLELTDSAFDRSFFLFSIVEQGRAKR